MLKIWLKSKKKLLGTIGDLQKQVNKLAHEKAALERSALGLKDAETYNYMLFKDAEARTQYKTKENEALKLRIEYLHQDIQAMKASRGMAA